MLFFKRWRKKRKEDSLEMQKMLQDTLDGVSEEDLSSKSKVQHYIIECCEQIIEASKEIEEEKNEYRVVTDYLNDIQTLEELPEEESQKLQSVAESIVKLDSLRDEIKNSKKNISDVQFVQMQTEQEEIPDAIKKMQTNEAYQSTVKKDMNYLEGEKTEWYYNKINLLHQQKMLRHMSFALVGLLVVCMAVLLVLQFSLYIDTTVAWMSVVMITAVSAFCIFIKMNANDLEIRQSEVNMNRAITLLNKVKFKYVNVTNAVDYAREKYHVKSAYELNYLWEQYLTEVREREKFRQTNEDLQYYNLKLIRQLQLYHLYDSRVWVNQASALVDKKEMVEVKHDLIVRRQKLRARIEYNMENIRNKRDEIDRLLKKENIYTKEIADIIASIDELSGVK